MKASDRGAHVASAIAGMARPSWASRRGPMAVCGVLVLGIGLTGSVALASTSDTPAAKAAAASTTSKAHYLLPVAALVRDGSVPAPTMAGDTGSVGVPSGTAPRPTAPPTTGTIPTTTSTGIGTYRGATGTMTPVGLATLALEAGCSAAEAPIATAISMAESGGSPSAQGDVSLMTPVWDWSAGLWQIRGLRSERGTGSLRDSVANQNAVKNAAAMYVISSGCTSWGPWTTYTRGLYLSYLSIGQDAVSFVLKYVHAHGGKYPPVAAPDPNAVIPVGDGSGDAAAAAAAAAQGGATPTSAASNKAKAKAKAKPGASSAASPAASTAAGGGGGAGGGAGGGGAAPPNGSTPTPSTGTTTTPGLPTLPLPTSKVPTLPLPKPTLPKPTLPKLPTPTLPKPSLPCIGLLC